MVPVSSDSAGEEEGVGREQKGPELQPAEVKEVLPVDATPDLSEGRVAEWFHETWDLAEVQDAGEDGWEFVSDQTIPADVLVEVDVVGDVPGDEQQPDACQPDCADKDCGPDGCGGDCGPCGQGVCIKGKCPPAGKECDDGNDTDWDGCTDGMLSEFQVNQYVVGFQHHPSVAMQSNGSFLIGWCGNAPFIQGSAVVLRLFDSNGQPVADEFLAAPPVTGLQLVPGMTVLADGRFVVAWPEVDAGEVQTVKARVLSGDGVPAGPPFLVSTTPSEPGGQLTRPVLQGFADGGFAVFWTDTTAPTPKSLSVIRSQRFDAAGQKLGGEVLLWGTGTYQPDVVPSTNGGCLISFTAYSGVPQQGSDVLMLALDESLNAVGLPTLVNQYLDDAQHSSSLALAGGGPVFVVWESTGQDGDMGGIFGRMADPAGKPFGDEFQVNAVDNGTQTRPLVESVWQNRFVVSWEGVVGLSNYEVFLRFFSASAAPLGGEIQVNVCTPGWQFSPAMATRHGSPIVLVWQSEEQDGDSSGIYARRFDIDGNPLYH
jgi:hypothetical protein